MATIKILVAEDNPIHASKLEMILEEMGYDLVGVYATSDDTLRMFNALKPDLVILDIELEGTKNGIDIASKINSIRPTPIIFATSFEDKDTILKALEQNPYAYLVKPIEKGSLQAGIELAIHKFGNSYENIPTSEYKGWSEDVVLKDSFFVKAGEKLVKLNIKDILWIELADERYCELVTSGRRYHLRTSLKNLEEKLDPQIFFRIHRTCIVNLTAIESIVEADSAVIVNGQSLPLGKSFKPILLQKIQKLI